jgi:anti-sigma regulatory factor (Ser/Thr protein kinase)
MSDEIVLTLPEQDEFRNVAHLVLGGLAVRLNLTFENLEDVQVALEGLLARAAGEITVAVRLDDDGLGIRVGPFGCKALRAELDDDRAEVGLRRVLETVSDGVEVRELEDGCWVDLRKTVERVE